MITWQERIRNGIIQASKDPSKHNAQLGTQDPSIEAKNPVIEDGATESWSVKPTTGGLEDKKNTKTNELLWQKWRCCMAPRKISLNNSNDVDSFKYKVKRMKLSKMQPNILREILFIILPSKYFISY